MTIICWDGTTLAADRRATSGGFNAYTAPKIFRAPDGSLYGTCGDCDAGAVLRRWFLGGADPAAWPTITQHDKDRWGTLLVIRPDASIELYLQEPHALLPDKGPIAIGSGRECGMTAMLMGASAAEAVAVTCRVRNDCGDATDTLRLADVQPPNPVSMYPSWPEW